MLKKKKKIIPKKKTVKAKKKIVKKKVAKKKVVKKAIKKVVKKVAKKAPAKKKPASKKAKENVIGLVTHYFPKVRAAVIKLKAPLSVGDTIKIKGHTTNFTQDITSMQMDRVPIDSGKKGEEVGLLVNSRVRQHDIVCKA
jgi:translation elongation factor EF-Tu-like GTPase